MAASTCLFARWGWVHLPRLPNQNAKIPNLVNHNSLGTIREHQSWRPNTRALAGLFSTGCLLKQTNCSQQHAAQAVDIFENLFTLQRENLDLARKSLTTTKKDHDAAIRKDYEAQFIAFESLTIESLPTLSSPMPTSSATARLKTMSISTTSKTSGRNIFAQSALKGNKMKTMRTKTSMKTSLLKGSARLNSLKCMVR
ncbi:hypothetical protein EJ07DRAFT_150952 [Lizonia empirigonia]|nr:hypothetical protein EJ07DRAFT_150952 [Lizonia empirigonia]